MIPKLVVLDRDGVINYDSANYIKTVDEWIPLPGSIEAIVRLQRHGITVAIATDQSGVGRGYYSLETLHAMHAKMNALIEQAGGKAITAIAYCPHTPEDECDCRKPKAGLLDQIEVELGVKLSGIPMVGDSLRDLQAGVLKGMKPILVRTGKGQITEAKLPEAIKADVFDDLSAFCNSLLI